MKSTLLLSARPPSLLPLLALLTLLTISTHASPNVDIDEEDGEDSHPQQTDRIFDNRWVEPLLVGIMSWNVMVVTLEVNDFRHRLVKTYEESPSSNQNSHRYIASLVAIRYGLFDALVDWFIICTIGYGIVAGITYTDADPDAQVVFLGFALIVCAALLAISGLRLPQWLGIHHLSRLQTLKDTSKFAPKAIHELTSEGSSITAFRYQVRLGVGKHFSQFVYFSLPFYVGLKVWAYLLSILVGVVFGHLVLFVVFVCRRRFKSHTRIVAFSASIFVIIISSLVFTRGMYVVEKGWNRNVENEDIFLTLSFFIWLACCLVGSFVRYHEQDRVSAERAENEEDEAHLFEDEEVNEGNTISNEPETGLESLTGDEHIPEDGPKATTNTLEEPLLDLRGVMEKSNKSEESSYFFETAYFERVKFRGGPESMDGYDENDDTDVAAPKEIYKTFAAIEESNMEMKWYHRTLNFLPVKPAWNLFTIGTRETFFCCVKDSEFKNRKSICHKCVYALSMLLKVCINLLAIYVASVACGATAQRKVTIQKLPYPKEVLYSKMNEGPVCAFNKKCGEVLTFPSKGDADMANYTIAHCGPCGDCSNWKDFPLQCKDLATPARTCGQKHLMGGIPETQACIIRDIGFSEDCALDWAKNIVCTRKHCAFIYIQSLMTNQVGNFKVGPRTITSATCSEASCEAGNPGDFVAHVGANRRRMNIRSEIERPKDQQCTIVGIEHDSNGYSMWDAFMDPVC